MKFKHPVPTILRQRREHELRRSHSSSQWVKRFGIVSGFFLALVFLVILVMGAFAFADITAELPSIQLLPVLLNPHDGLLLEPTRIYDRTGSTILRTLAPHDGRRSYINYEEIPKSLVNAILALADVNFWQGAGFELKGWQNPESHPTLAQKLVYNLLLFSEPASTRRAIRERLLAAQVMHEFGREKLIEWYLNSARFGHEIVGVSEAAEYYFHQPVEKLDLGQSAMLAAISQAPALNPVDTPQAAEIRRLETLRLLLALQLADQTQVGQAMATPPSIFSQQGTSLDPAPLFTELVLHQLSGLFSRDRLELGGLKIITTLDEELQNQVACTQEVLLIRLAGVENPQTSNCPSSAFLFPFLPAAAEQSVTASAMILDPKTGQVLAYSGNSGGSHPAGTLLTPFIYLTGFSRGFNPSSLGWDIPGDFVDFDQDYSGPVSFRTAMRKDLLAPAFQIEDQMGSEAVWRTLSSFGLEGTGGDVLLSDLPLSMLQVAGMYSVFANQGIVTGQEFQGKKIQPSTVMKLTGYDQQDWGDWSFPQKKAIVSPALAYLVNDILTAVDSSQVSGNPLGSFAPDRPISFKMGRNLAQSGAWAIGYSPQRLVVTWMDGVDQEAGNSQMQPVTAFWRSIQTMSEKNLSPETWSIPEGIVRMPICEASGMLPTSICPEIVDEVFLSGNQPIQQDSFYVELEVNRETGLLANVFTPLDLVEDQVFMQFPALAETWVQTNGIPVPPKEYDTVLKPAPLENTHITSPDFFADVRSVVQIHGSATGEGFSFYRLEYGLGMKPENWQQIGKDIRLPVRDELLGKWDTGSLEGLVILRLVAVHENQRVEMAMLPLVIDNSPPAIKVDSPLNGQLINMMQMPGVEVIVQVEDPGLARVQIFLDGILQGDFSQAPFTLIWKAKAGDHRLQIIATDRAGNQAKTTSHFTVEK